MHQDIIITAHKDDLATEAFNTFVADAVKAYSRFSQFRDVIKLGDWPEYLHDL